MIPTDEQTHLLIFSTLFTFEPEQKVCCFT